MAKWHRFHIDMAAGPGLDDLGLNVIVSVFEMKMVRFCKWLDLGGVAFRFCKFTWATAIEVQHSEVKSKGKSKSKSKHWGKGNV